MQRCIERLTPVIVKEMVAALEKHTKYRSKVLNTGYFWELTEHYQTPWIQQTYWKAAHECSDMALLKEDELICFRGTKTQLLEFLRNLTFDEPA